MKNLKVVLPIIVVLAIALIGGGAYYAKNYATPYNRWEAAMWKSSKANQADMTYRVSYNLVPEKYEEYTGVALAEADKANIEFANEMLKKSILEMNYKLDWNKTNPIDSKMQYSMAVLYDNNMLADVVASMDENDISLSMPSLITSTFFVSKDELFKTINFDYKNFDFGKYVKIIDSQSKNLAKADKAAYMKSFETFFKEKVKKGEKIDLKLADGKTVKCTELIVEMTFEEYMKLLKEMKDIAKKDEGLREYVRGLALAIAEEMLSSKDYEKLSMTKEDLEKAIEELKDATSFEEDFSELFIALDQMFVQMDTMVSEMNLTYVMKYAVDSSNTMRGLTMDMDMGFVKAKYELTINSLNKKVDFASYPDNKKINIMEMMGKGNEEIAKITEELVKNSGDKLVENKGLDSLMKDIMANINKLPQESRAAVEAMASEFNNDKEKFIKDMINQIIMTMSAPSPYEMSPEYNYEDMNYDMEGMDYQDINLDSYDVDYDSMQ